MIIHEWISKFEQLFPRPLAESWDNVGLQVGDLSKNLQGVLLTLDVTHDVIEEAIAHNCNLIVSHHPLLFRPQSQIDTSTYFGKMIEMIITHDITVYSAHTNFDSSSVGLNYILAEMLHLQGHRPLQEISDTEGLGRIGQLPQQIPLPEFIEMVKKTLRIDALQLIGNENIAVTKVALCGGSGSSLIDDAIRQQADVYISGDITYHHALDAKNIGLTILDVGHNIEKEVLPTLQNQVAGFDNSIPIIVSKIDTNPYKTK